MAKKNFGRRLAGLGRSLLPAGGEYRGLAALGLFALAGIVLASGVLAPDPAVEFLPGEPGDYEPVFDINRAGVEELILVEGVGPVTARRIVADREERGPFASLDEVTRVRGVGPKTLERIARYFRVGPGAPAGRASPGEDTGEGEIRENGR